MPLYDYRCRDCSKVVEVRHGFREPYDGTCAECGGGLARVFNPAGIVFKGSGFYVTDSRKSTSSESSSSGTSESSKTEPAKSEPGKTDSAPAKTESKPKTESSAA